MSNNNTSPASRRHDFTNMVSVRVTALKTGDTICCPHTGDDLGIVEGVYRTKCKGYLYVTLGYANPRLRGENRLSVMSGDTIHVRIRNS